MKAYCSTQKKGKALNKLFLPLLSLVYLGLTLTVQAEEWRVVEQGQYFWQISKPGLNPSFSYIMGSKHRTCLDENSLPIEIKRALNNSKVGLLEVTREIAKEETMLQTISLPEGLTLSHYLGEEKVREIFDFFQFLIANYDTKERDLEKFLNTLNVNTRDYNHFNCLVPQTLNDHLLSISESFGQITNSSNEEHHQVIREFITSTKKLYDGDPSNDFEHRTYESDLAIPFKMEPEFCSSREPLFIDTFIEKFLFCNRRPIYPLETAIDKLSAILFVSQDLKIEANNLYDDTFSAIKHKRFKLENKSLSSPFAWTSLDIPDTMNRPPRPFEIFQFEVYTAYYKISLREMDIFHGIFPKDSLVKNFLNFIIDVLIFDQCPISPEIDFLVDTYVDKLLQKLRFEIKTITGGKAMDEEMTETYLKLISESKQMERDIFSACFPNYQYSNRELEDNSQEELYELKKILGLAISRDPIFVQSLLPFLDEGGVFILMGFNHLSGVINRLRAAGYNVNPIQLSSSIIEANCW